MTAGNWGAPGNPAANPTPGNSTPGNPASGNPAGGAYPPGGYPHDGGYYPGGGYPPAGGNPTAGLPTVGPWAPAGPVTNYPAGPVVTAQAPRRGPGLTGIVVASSGAALAVLGLFLSWYSVGTVHIGLKDLVRGAESPTAPGFTHLYFSWALWVVLAVAILTGIAANVAGSSIALLAGGGAVLAVASTAMTYGALNAAEKTGSALDHSAIGLWLVLLGPLVLAAGALAAFARPAR